MNTIGYCIQLMDKGEYKDSLELLTQVESVVLQDEGVGVDTKVDMLVGKASMQLILAQQASQSLYVIHSLIT